MYQREKKMRKEIEKIEHDLILLALTGVEDKLQQVYLFIHIYTYLYIFLCTDILGTGVYRGVYGFLGVYTGL